MSPEGCNAVFPGFGFCDVCWLPWPATQGRGSSDDPMEMFPVTADIIGKQSARRHLCNFSSQRGAVSHLVYWSLIAKLRETVPVRGLWVALIYETLHLSHREGA